ncbi:MAG TPA: Clp protease N-terminal domain-containing protein [Actinomycetes bacterium]|nr:Clp protease N-terminal domain-containing protein [Actinomycetes bacterium]
MLGRALRDLVTVTRLLTTAESEARHAGRERPGPEDLLLAALSLPDGTAARVFRRFGLDEGAVRTAIATARAEDGGSDGVRGRAGAYRATPAGQAVFRAAVALTKESTPRSRLLGAHVVAASADLDRGVVARALRRLAIDPATLRTTACAQAREDL